MEPTISISSGRENNTCLSNPSTRGDLKHTQIVRIVHFGATEIPHGGYSLDYLCVLPINYWYRLLIVKTALSELKIASVICSFSVTHIQWWYVHFKPSVCCDCRSLSQWMKECKHSNCTAVISDSIMRHSMISPDHAGLQYNLVQYLVVVLPAGRTQHWTINQILCCRYLQRLLTPCVNYKCILTTLHTVHIQTLHSIPS